MGEVEKTRSTGGLQAKFWEGPLSIAPSIQGYKTENKRGIHSREPAI